MAVDDLYQDILLDHARSPRGRGEVGVDEALADERNPLCGDDIRLVLRIEAGRVRDLRWDGRGCAISTASASLMALAVEGRSDGDSRRLSARVVRWLRGEDEAPEGLDDLAALAGVQAFPMRVKCATLCWHALDRALDRAVPGR